MVINAPIPKALLAHAEQAWQSFAAQLTQHSEFLALIKSDWCTVAAISDYFAHQTNQNADDFFQAWNDDQLSRSFSADEYQRQIAEHNWASVSDAKFAAELRQFRHRSMVRIVWRDLLGLATLEETMRDLSHLADACISFAAEALYQHMASSQASVEQASPLLVIAMGKLGGHELNFSSDVDLIFAYQDPNHPHEFFIKLAQKLIKLLDAVSKDGRVFRVDMRLRPFGSSGPLAMSLSQLSAYYQQQGRDWERYAFVKARVINGDNRQKVRLKRLVTPFVYRRYVDYGAIEALRQMKQLINREIQTNKLDNDIKRGPGGIRQIEFIGQAFQLVHGGQDKHLQQRQIIPVLCHLAKSGTLAQETVDCLISAYCFLRKVEHVLQMIDDQQTHALPANEKDQLRVAFALGYQDFDTFHNELNAARKKVSEHFDQMVAEPEQQQSAVQAEPIRRLKPIWAEALAEEQAEALLATFSYQNSNETYAALMHFKTSYRVRHLSSQAKQRLDQLIPQVLYLASEQACPDLVFKRILSLLDSIIQRSAYLALLLENPKAMQMMTELFAKSDWIAQQVIALPLLLDELTHAKNIFRSETSKQISDDIRQSLLAIPVQDLEQQMDALRRFKHRQVLRIAAADVSERMTVSKVSEQLCHVADAIMQQVDVIAWDDVSARFADASSDADFAIVAYGKLGSYELSYGSDLDLVFLHQKPVEQVGQMIRLGQRIVRMLNTRTAAGVLYQVDTRLRPSGSSGLLVSHFQAYADYLRDSAWTFEHQALVRARVVVGPEELVASFNALRVEILSQKRDKQQLQQDIMAMRQRLQENRSQKAIPGGLADIEFMVQYAVLAHAAEHPSLTQYTDNSRILQQLASLGLLAEEDVGVLLQAYNDYREHNHREVLLGADQQAVADLLAKWQARVLAMWPKLFEQHDQ